MKSIVLSYSLTGNNGVLADSIAGELGIQHFKITESKTRTMVTIAFDVLFNRTPQVKPTVETVDGYDLVIIVAPVWMGMAATPLRAYLKHFKTNPGKYAFISISGGADGPNPKLESDLYKRTGKKPVALVDLHIADLLPPVPKPTRDATSAYRISEKDLISLTNKAVEPLREIMATLPT